ncbi:MAG TPA: hypothetical protein VHG09_04350 [Longimicrobiales bacterium]|nr:hypothetical protein [Longimicrobiales bacterium]
MRYAHAMMVAIAVFGTACSETADEAADDNIRADTSAMIDGDTVGTDAAASLIDGDTVGPDAAASPSGGDSPSAKPSAKPSANATPPASDAPDAPRDDSADDPGADVAASIPSRFHGEWNAELAACGTGSSVTRLRISADQLRFYESTASVREVDIQSERVITVTAEYEGEGDTWQDERRLSLSEDGNSLTVSNGSELVRYRCP